MNNFEKRMFLDYLEALANLLDLETYDFDDTLESFIYHFHIKRTTFNFNKEGVVTIETKAQKAELVKQLKKAVAVAKTKLPVRNTKLEEKLLLIKDIYKLNDKEYQAFVYLILQEINQVFYKLDGAVSGNSFDKFSKYYLKVRFGEKDRIMNALYMSKLISDRSSNPSVNEDLIAIFDNPNCNSTEKVVNFLIGTPEKSTLTLKDYAHMEKETNKVINILKSAIEKKAKGVNILLWGDCGTGKTEMSKLVANAINTPIYAVTTIGRNENEAKREERLADLNSKQQVLARTGNACILFDEAEDVLNRGWSENGTASKGYLNRLLENVGCPVIWTTNNISDVDPAFLRRFKYAVEFNELDEKTRLNVWNKVVRKNKIKVSKSKIKELSENYDVSPSIIANAVESTKMIGGDENDFEDFIESVAKIVNKKRDVKEDKKEESPLGSYDIRLVHADIDMQDLTEKIKQSGKMNFSLCLYGIPGTGKSRFALHLAKKLGINAVIKKVSEIQSCYVGECEKNIAAAFKECEESNSMLILDECDTFLQDRSNAVRQWEISQVNELLVNMENTKIPFVATTNLMDTLDQASLRRFTFKIRMDYMTKEQVKLAFKHFFNLDTNFYIPGLCCGDCANVAKKCEYLNITDFKTISKMLQEEVDLKKIPELKKNTIGF